MKSISRPSLHLETNPEGNAFNIVAEIPGTDFVGEIGAGNLRDDVERVALGIRSPGWNFVWMLTSIRTGWP